MKIVFMGTPDFAAANLKALIDAGHEILAVVTQPDKPQGRSGALRATPVKELALLNNIPVYQPEKIRKSDMASVITEMKPDIIVVVAFGQILPKDILDIPKYGCVNVHASLLPKYRGAAPIQWAVINGDKESGVATMLMDEGLDTGDTLIVSRYTLREDETGGSLFDHLQELGAKTLCDTLTGLENGTVKPTPQIGEATYAAKLDKALGKLDFTKSAAELERLIRGLNPWPSAYTALNGKTLKIWKARVTEDATEAAPGTITRIDKKSFVIKTGEGGLEILELQLEGKKRMDTESFLRGYQLEQGTVL